MRVINVPVVKKVNGKDFETMQQEKIYEIEELAYLGKLYSSKDYKKRDHKGGYVNYIDIPCAFDIETTNIEEDIWTFRDEDVYKYIRSLKIRYTENLKKNITDFDYIRKRYFNQVRLLKNSGRYVDTVYDELHGYRPDLFPDDIINEEDQLLQILDVYDQNRPLKKGEFRPYAFMYHWQFCFEDQVVFGRTWKDFKKLLGYLEHRLNLSYHNRLVVYVHNLSFEWQFMRKFVEFEDGFFVDKYKPLKILLKNGIEFRDSLALSNMKLEKFCEHEKNVIHRKLSGEEFNYDTLRTPAYKLSEYEEGYCYNDVRGLVECIKSRYEEFNVVHIPMTSTGYVRNDARKMMRQNRKNREKFLDLALNKDLYKMCRDAFRGGDTHANRKIVNKLLKYIQSFDITSSYPASMMMDKYPMTAFSWISLDTFYKLDFNEDAVLMEVMIVNPKYKGNCNIPYIPISKCSVIPDIHHRIEDNGRLLKADGAIVMTLTEIDYQIIMNEYDFDEIRYNEDKMYAAKKGYLPKELRDCIMKYYRKKTELKDVKGKEYEYNRAKALLNALYGMMVMRIDQGEVKYVDGKYVESEPDLEAVLQKYYKSRNNFLSYQWGVWVTANSRKRLRDMLNVIGKDVCYVDTDSIKCKNDHRKDFEKINKEIKKTAILSGAFAKNKDGITFYLGTWDYEGTYEKFKTLGAKKYLLQMWVKNEETGEDELKTISTIAGVDKKVGAKYFEENGFDHFTIGEPIPKSGHIVAFYNDSDIHDVIIDGEHIENGSNLALINDVYTIGITDSFEYLLDRWYQDIEELEYM